MTPYGSLESAMDNCVICTSLGKSFNFTGTSHANIIIPNDAIRARYITQRNSDHYGSLSPFMRAATLGAYSQEGKAWIDALMGFYCGKRAHIRRFSYRILPAKPHSAATGRDRFCGWISARWERRDEVAALFRKAGIEPDLGSKYGAPGEGFMRLQIGMPQSELTAALSRFGAVLKNR